MRYSISQEVLQRAINYLLTQPYGAVVDIIEDLKKDAIKIEEKIDKKDPV